MLNGHMIFVVLLNWDLVNGNILLISGILLEMLGIYVRLVVLLLVLNLLWMMLSVRLLLKELIENSVRKLKFNMENYAYVLLNWDSGCHPLPITFTYQQRNQTH